MIRIDGLRNALVATLVVGCGVAFGLAPARARAACTGDCNSDGKVDVGEVQTMINIDLDPAQLDKCMPGDVNHDGMITIDEVVGAAHDLLNGCPANPTPTPTLGPLGTRHFVLNPATSVFKAVVPSLHLTLTLGSFRGQTDGQTEPAFLDLVAGKPDPATGYTTVDVMNSSQYFVASSVMFGMPIAVCLRPIVPVVKAGAIDCKGTLPYSFQTMIDHSIGVVGENGFTVMGCETTCNGPDNCGHVESPNQICAAGFVGGMCRTNAECDSTMGANDGVCGLGPATCTMGKAGQCRADGDCDTTPTSGDGVCSNPEPDPGVCNGPLTFSVLPGATGPGAVIIAPDEQIGLNGLPVELSIENAPPCGDEGPGQQITFALTTGTSKSTILDVNNTGTNGSGMQASFSSQGQNFSCTDWQDTNSPGRLVLTAPTLNLGGFGDLITAFIFDGAPSPPTPTPTHTPST